ELMIVSLSSLTAELQWEAVEEADSYNIYRSPLEQNNYILIGTTATSSYTDRTVTELEQYAYAVTAVGEAGESLRSASIEVSIPHSTYRFDFGTSTSPVAEGHTVVTEQTLYTEALGYGFLTAPGSRLRTAPSDDPLRVDFVLLGEHQFDIDLPNGDYKVRIIAGDGTNSQTTNGDIQGVPFTQLKTNAGEFKEYIGSAAVVNGKLNILFTQGRVNALYITPLAAVTEGLQAAVEVNEHEPTIKLSWEET